MLRTLADLSEEETQELIDTFSLVDVNGDKVLSGKEVLDALKGLPQDEKDEEVFELIREIEKDTSGHVTREEYMEYMANQLTDMVTRKDVEMVFRMFDVHNQGTITIDALRKVAMELGDPLSDAELQSMINIVDGDGDGKVTLEEFHRLMTRRV